MLKLMPLDHFSKVFIYSLILTCVRHESNNVHALCIYVHLLSMCECAVNLLLAPVCNACVLAYYRTEPTRITFSMSLEGHQ